MTYKFGLTGQDRKALVDAISAITNQPKKYLGVLSMGYTIGDIMVDKHSMVTGELSTDILEELAERGFQAEIETMTDTAALEVEANEPEAEVQAEPEDEAEIDTISITMPLDGFTPESLENLCRMVISKAPLIEKALGVEPLPIKVLDNGIEFPWFRAGHKNDMMAYAQFLSALCTTAKEKRRVTAKPQEFYENERFTLRVWLIGLGLVGAEYGKIRQLLTKPLNGNGAWRYGTPEKAALAPEAAAEAIDVPDNASEEAPTDEPPADTQPEAEDANVADTITNEGEVVGDE